MIKRERIVSIGDSLDQVGNGTLTIRGDGMFAVPGLIDAHIHVESSMLTLTEFSKVATQHGTTSIVWDPHEIVNVAGIDAMRIVIRESKTLPLHVFFVAPSCVPSAPGKETSGARLDLADTQKALNLPNVIGLGEMMDLPGVLSCSSNVIRKIELARRMHVGIDGHAPGLRGKELSAYIASGIRSDHESVSKDEGLEKLRLGMWLMIREGSSSKDLGNLIKPLIAGTIDTRHCMFVSDDITVSDLLYQGHMDHILKRALSEGLDPITAIQLVTINPATYLHMENEIGSISPGYFADILLLKDLKQMEIKKVIVMGTELHQRLFEKSLRFPRKLTSSFVFKRRLTSSDFIFKSMKKVNKLMVRVIGIREGTIVTSRESKQLAVENGIIRATGDVLYAAVVERHHQTGNIGKGFVTGLGALRGAIAQSIAHDSHNLIVIGSNPLDMAFAAKTVASMQGGVALSSGGTLIASLSLEIGGLMTRKSAGETAKRKELLEAEAAKLGFEVRSLIASASFLSLPVVPEMRLTDKGLYDVNEGRFIDTVIE